MLAEELERLLPEHCFASNMWKRLGDELYQCLVDWPGAEEVGRSSQFPAECLYLWIVQSGGLDPRWLARDDGSYVDDDYEPIQKTFDKSYFGIEQLASLGLWFLLEVIDWMGSTPDESVDGDGESINEEGEKRSAVIEHKASCLLFAYQCVIYAHKLANRASLTTEEERKTTAIDFSRLGKAGAAKRHAPMATLRTWAVDRYREGDWRSANKAAHDLKEEVLAHGRTIGAFLSEENAQRTIATWFRKSV